MKTAPLTAAGTGLQFVGVGHLGGSPVLVARERGRGVRGRPVGLHLRQLGAVETCGLQRAFVQPAHAGGLGGAATLGVGTAAEGCVSGG